jgi:hypothetical protein
MSRPGVQVAGVVNSAELDLFREALARIVGGPADVEHARGLVELRISGANATAVGQLSDEQFVGLPVTVVDDKPATQIRDADADHEWSELLYDLLAHSDPLSGLGASLYYSFVRREGKCATVAVTDGVSTLERTVSLAHVVDGFPDEIAMSFLDDRR